MTKRRFSQRRPINSPPPVPDVPPFWLKITSEEMFLYGRLTEYDAVARGAGFKIARFLITVENGEPRRQTVVGYVRGNLGAYIARADGHHMAFLIHLPTGFCVSRTLDDTLILFVADVIGPIIDGCEDVAAVDEASKLYLPQLEATGLRCVNVPMFGQSVVAWIRAHETVGQAMGLPQQQIHGGGR